MSSWTRGPSTGKSADNDACPDIMPTQVLLPRDASQRRKLCSLSALLRRKQRAQVADTIRAAPRSAGAVDELRAQSLVRYFDTGDSRLRLEAQSNHAMPGSIPARVPRWLQPEFSFTAFSSTPPASRELRRHRRGRAASTVFSAESPVLQGATRCSKLPEALAYSNAMRYYMA